jgi:pilus assembly protein CpaC
VGQIGLLIGALLWSGGALLVAGQITSPVSPERDLSVSVGKSLIVESPVVIQRIAVGDSKCAEAIAVTPREVLVNGKDVCQTSLIVWQQGGNRLMFNLRVRRSGERADAVREEIRKELPGQDVTVTQEGGDVFLRGTVPDLVSADRAARIAETLGKPVNLLRVKTPPAEDQILLKVRFADVDRSASTDLGLNLFSTGAGNTLGAIQTGQTPAPSVNVQGGGGKFTLSDALNVFLFRTDLDLGMTLRALQAKRLLQILAEPNLLAMNGEQASFLAGGEFPVPVVQVGVGGSGGITIMWREYGIRVTFLPTVTPRGTIRLKVAPEVSSLDLANAVTISGFSVPALSTRKMSTMVELESGQSFAIAGLLDNRVTEQLSKIPGLSSVPVLGKLFQSRSMARSNTELLVVVTPELVRPIPSDKPAPAVKFPEPFLQDGPAAPPRTPGMAVTGPVPVHPASDTVPVERLQTQKDTAPAPQIIQLVPMAAGQQAPAPSSAAPAQNAPAESAKP